LFPHIGHYFRAANARRPNASAAPTGTGLRGIGAFYDEEVHRDLNLASEQEPVVNANRSCGPDPRAEA
jgi:hypothetical protein